MRVYPGISAVDLGVLDLEAAVRFYERLGFRRSPWREASTALFQLNTIVLRLHEAPPAAGERGRAQGRDVSLAQYHASAEAVEGALEEAGGAGARLLARPPARRRGDGRRGAFCDPDGHVWELIYDPRHVLGVDGSLSLGS
ncbi:MAG TPA: VOC family protein [Beijerinckiaceae bacterium]|nr:VOC family protein [Beijerinckiaceae bacterium]